MAANYWQNLYQKMLAALESGAFMQFSGYSVPGRTFTYRSLKEFQTLLEWVKAQAGMEAGKPPYRGRTYAGNRGRG